MFFIAPTMILSLLTPPPSFDFLGGGTPPLVISKPYEGDNRFAENSELYEQTVEKVKQLNDRYKNNPLAMRKHMIAIRLIDWLYGLPSFHGPITDSEMGVIDLMIADITDPETPQNKNR